MREEKIFHIMQSAGHMARHRKLISRHYAKATKQTAKEQIPSYSSQPCTGKLCQEQILSNADMDSSFICTTGRSKETWKLAEEQYEGIMRGQGEEG